MDDARGAYAAGPETIFDDLDVEKAKAIPPTALHHNVDLLILDADTQGYMRGYLVNPSTVYGAPTHELVVAGITNTHSIQIPVLIQAALARKRAGMVGAGKAIWPAIHVDDSESYPTAYCRRSPLTVSSSRRALHHALRHHPEEA